MIQVSDAAAGRRAGAVRRGQQRQQRGAGRADADADHRIGQDRQRQRRQATAPPSITVAWVASTPPNASTAMPPMIHGVRRQPRSEPWPHFGRLSCTA